VNARGSTVWRQIFGWTKRVAAALLVLICVVVGYLYFRQHAMLYHPRRYPAELALPANTTAISYMTRAGQQTAFYVSRGGTALPDDLIIAFGGNASLALDWTWLISHDEQPGHAYLLVDYPGYGQNSGTASIDTTRATADGALTELCRHLQIDEAVAEARLSTLGHSWGSAVALDFASRHPVRRVVLIAPFTTLREEAALVVGRPLSHLLIENYDNRERLAELARRDPRPKVHIFHGERDDIIPIAMGRELAIAYPGWVNFHLVPRADHISVIAEAQHQIISALQE
jgi:pimeloyl-ACP methyl ester carboxylesterase